jgi:Uma2 family endonuclease
VSTPTASEPVIEYPEQDGQPMSDNTVQFRWIVTIQGNLDGMYANDPNVFVAGDLLWYPVEGQPTIRAAPDALVAFGRPRGDRGSYLQWHENGVPPQVVFEIRSPSNRPEEMDRKFGFYDRYGVEEYYLYDPDENWLLGWVRRGEHLDAVVPMHGWVSPRLGIRFDMSGPELVIYRPDGKRFLTFAELMQLQDEAQRQAELERLAREQAQSRAEAAQRAKEQAEQDAAEARRRAERLAERLRALGIDPEA